MQLSLHFAAPGRYRQRIEKSLHMQHQAVSEKRLSDAVCVAFSRAHAPRELVCQLAELIMERVGWLSSELFARLINLQWDSLCMSALLINKHDGGVGGCSTWEPAGARWLWVPLLTWSRAEFSFRYQEFSVDPPTLLPLVLNFNYFPVAQVVQYSTENAVGLGAKVLNFTYPSRGIHFSFAWCKKWITIIKCLVLVQMFIIHFRFEFHFSMKVPHLTHIWWLLDINIVVYIFSHC